MKLSPAGWLATREIMWQLSLCKNNVVLLLCQILSTTRDERSCKGTWVFLLQMLCLELANKGQETEKVMNVMAICKAVKSISYNPHIDYCMVKSWFTVFHNPLSCITIHCGTAWGWLRGESGWPVFWNSVIFRYCFNNLLSSSQAIQWI